MSSLRTFSYPLSASLERKGKVIVPNTMRKVIAQRTLEAKQQIPHYYLAILIYGPADKHIGKISVFVVVNNEIADIRIMLGEKEYCGKDMEVKLSSGLLTFLKN